MPSFATVIGAFAAVLLAAPAAAPASTAPPLDVIRSVHEEIAKLLGTSTKVTPETRDRVMALIETTSDFPTIAATVIGPRWSAVPPDQQEAFVRSFARLVGYTSIEKMGRFRADRFEYVGQQIDGERATVNTVAFYEKKRVTLDYQMASTPDGWRIVDYSFNGVLSSRSYRRQFDRLLQREDFASLLRRVRQRLDRYEKSAGPPSATR
jgi:phospholipid transport system substrate-binding protein